METTFPTQVVGFVASCHLVVVVEEGDGWVKHGDDEVETFHAPHLLVWEPGDWVEYGSLRGITEQSYFGPRVRPDGWHPTGDDTTGDQTSG